MGMLAIPLAVHDRARGVAETTGDAVQRAGLADRELAVFGAGLACFGGT